MTIKELGELLFNMYSKAPKGEQVAHIHLFGVKYGEMIMKNHLSIKEIIAESGIKSSYHTELSKGVKLSKYVYSKT